VNANYGGQIN